MVPVFFPVLSALPISMYPVGIALFFHPAIFPIAAILYLTDGLSSILSILHLYSYVGPLNKLVDRSALSPRLLFFEQPLSLQECYMISSSSTFTSTVRDFSRQSCFILCSGFIHIWFLVLLKT